MTWCIYGAGAIGGVVGAQLSRAGEDVALVARGSHLRAIEEHGLTLVDPDGEHVVEIPVADSVAPFGLTEGDIVVLAVKTQQTAAALAELARTAPAGVRILCLQNGIDNERQALRYFADVYAASVTLLASYTRPGVVLAHSAPTVGILQIGRYPAGADDVAESVAASLRAAGMQVDVSADIMPYKNLKLLRNLGNAIEVVCSGPAPTILERMTVEAEEVFRLAGLALPDPDEVIPGPHPVDPAVPREGGSTLQSILRGSGSVETDYLNGEVVLLGRLHGVEAPVNALLQRLARRAAAGDARRLTEDEVLGMLA